MDGNQNVYGTEYLSFLLRMRRVSVDGAPAWRASLQRPGAEEAMSFVDLEELLDFLYGEMDKAGSRPLERE